MLGTPALLLPLDAISLTWYFTDTTATYRGAQKIVGLDLRRVGRELGGRVVLTSCH